MSRPDDHRVAIIGANGQFGKELVKMFGSTLENNATPTTAFVHYECDVDDYPLQDLCIDVKAVDITDFDYVKEQINDFDIVINTAAYHDINACEENQGIAWNVNTHGSSNVAKRCERIGAEYVLISTDYVFGGKPPTNGEKDYSPEDFQNPINVYGKSKSAAEQAAHHYCRRSLVARCSYLYGEEKCRGKKSDNLIDWIYNSLINGETINAWDNTAITLTYAYQAAGRLIGRLFNDNFSNRDRKYIHLNDSGIVSHYDVAMFMAELLNIENSDIVPTECKHSIKPLKTPLQPINGSAEWKWSLVQYLTFKGWYHKDEVSGSNYAGYAY